MRSCVWYSTCDSKVRQRWVSDLPGKVLWPCTWMPKRHVEKHWFVGTGLWGCNVRTLAGYLCVLCVLNLGLLLLCPMHFIILVKLCLFLTALAYFDWQVFVLWAVNISRLTIKKRDYTVCYSSWDPDKSERDKSTTLKYNMYLTYFFFYSRGQ